MTFQFNETFPDAPNDKKWDQIRLWRNAELAASDWTQLADSSVDKVAWATYRQALRDLPAQGGKAEEASFPVKP